MIVWSKNPGCFERDLQRRYQYPFWFGSRTAAITSDDVEAARQRDLEEARELRTAVYQMIEWLRGTHTVAEVVELVPRISEMLQRAAEIGGEITDIQKSLTEGRSAAFSLINDSMDDSAQFAEKQKTYEALDALGCHSFIAQSGRSDTPIKKEGQVAALLTESPKIINEVMTIWEKKQTD